MANLEVEEVLCPVCGLQLDLEPWRRELRFPLLHYICPCCGFHFGYDDEGGSGFHGTKEEIYQSYRNLWIRFRMPWVHDQEPKPVDWNPRKQLERIGVEL